jgi:hypothetical protein
VTGTYTLCRIIQYLRLQEVHNLLEGYDVINAVRYPIRATSSTKCLMDRVIINKDNQELIATVEHLGFSDRLVQILIKSGICNMRSKMVVTKQFT